MDNISANNRISTANNIRGVENTIVREGQDLDKAGQELLRSMSSGETFRGRISDITGNQATIMVDEDTRIVANLNKDMNLSVGQSVVFEVNSESSDVVSLRALFTNTASENIANNALSQANIPINNTSLAVVSSLMEQGLSIDKDTLGAVYRSVVANPEVRPEEIVQMKSIGLDLTQDNITKFDAVFNFQNKISESINTLINQMPTELAKMADSDLSSALKMASTFIENASEGGGTEVSVSLGDIALSNEGALLSEENLSNSENLEEETNSSATKADNQIKTIISDLENEGLIDGDEGQTIEENITERELSDQISLTNKDFDTLSKLISKDNEFANNILDKLSEGGKIDVDELLKTFDSILKDPNVSDADKKSLIKSDLFKNSLTDRFTEKWLIEPAEIKDSESLSNHYNKILDSASKMVESMSDTVKGNENLTNSVNNLKENVQFLQTLNDLTPYVQLPVLINNKSNTGDLYVYAKKKSLLENQENISAVLRLDMANLGRVQVYVKLNQNKNLSTDFTLPDDATLKFIEDHIDMLNEKLEKLGFNVTNSFNTDINKHEPFSEDNSEEKKDKGDNIGFYRFDVRA